MIRNMSTPRQWNYVDSGANPADLATRDVTAKDLSSSQWLTGPDFLKKMQPTDQHSHDNIPLNEDDPEIRRHVNTFTSEMQVTNGLTSGRFIRFSTWPSLHRGLANLIVKAKEFKAKRASKYASEEDSQVTNSSPKHNGHSNAVSLPRVPTIDEFNQAKMEAIKAAQEDSLSDELRALRELSSDPPSNRQRDKEQKKLMKSS